MFEGEQNSEKAAARKNEENDTQKPFSLANEICIRSPAAALAPPAR
jgi:hypothetical protein